MTTNIHILVVEDSEDDFVLLQRHVRSEQFAATCKRVDTAKGVQDALSQGGWDLVISDMKLPGFHAPAVIEIVRRVAGDLPVIVVSGVVSEEELVATMRAGANDVLLKDRLVRLVPAIERELKEHAVRRAQRDAEARFSAAVEHISQGLVMFDDKQRLIRCNSSYARMYNLPPDLTEQGTERARIDEYTRASGLVRNSNSPPDGDLPQSDAFQMRGMQKLSDGRVIAFSSHPLPTGGWVSTYDDITDQKRTEAELIGHRDHLQELVDAATEKLRTKADVLEKALDQERELNRLKSHFIATASHEFRTPLTIIDFSAQRLRRRVCSTGIISEDVVVWADKILTATRRMARLMDTTLAAARMDEGKVRLRLESCDIGKVVRDCCERYQEFATKHTIVCDADLVGTIYADAAAMEQVVSNLISNAVKYSPDASTIHVNARGSGEQTVLTVKDHGIGIGEPDLKHIFDRFFRAKTSQGIPGTGIGLNIVKSLVEQHGGSIKVESVEGEGTTIIVSLPIAGPPAQKGRDSNKPHYERAPSGAQERVTSPKQNGMGVIDIRLAR